MLYERLAIGLVVFALGATAGWQVQAWRWGRLQAEQQAKAATERERQLAGYVEAWTLAARKQQEIADDARKTAARNASAARAAAAAAGGLRDDLAAALADAAAADAAAGQCAATAAAARVSADVLGRAGERAGVLARYADEAAAAGGACERAYRALTP